MLEAEKKQREREAAKARQAAIPQQFPQGYDPGMPPPPMEDDMYMPVDMPPVATPQEYVPELPGGPIIKDYPYLAACEEELLTFVLEYGCTELLFEHSVYKFNFLLFCKLATIFALFLSHRLWISV